MAKSGKQILQADTWLPKAWPALLLALLMLFALFSDRLWDGAKSCPPTEIGYLVDPGGRMSIAQAASPEAAGRYVVKQDNRMSLGFSRSALWLRFALDQAPTSGPWVLVVAAPWMDRIDLFLPDPQKGWQRQSTGLQQPGGSVVVGGFALAAPADAPRSGYAYLRLESVLALNAGLRLWSRAELEHHILVGAYFFGGLYGIMLAMACINFVVFLTIRDRVNLLYVLYLISMIIHQFCLQGQILLLPMPFWPAVPALSLVVSAFVFFFGAAFCRAFLDAKVHAPAADRLLIGAQMAAAVLLVLALTNRLLWGTWLTHSLAVIGPLVAIAAGIRTIKRGYWPARIYLLAWLVLLIGIVGWGAWSMGWLDRLRPRHMTLTVAAALESCLLALALAERVRMVHLERRVLAQRERRYHQLSITDELTGLYNQRYFWNQLASELERAHELGQPLSLLLMDLDDFKGINDRHGHDAGDRILAGVGGLLRENVRPADTACRYGGEEFALILPGADASAAMEVAERVRR
ncbi:MAG: diguanylate cyclase, partial [Parvularculaceae bacterium]|nr:diguanylate cyclase [Parvularculaceae bacterium]